MQTRLILVKTLLAPIITYGSQLYSCMDSISKQKLNVAFNSCIRFVHSLRPSDYVSHMTHCIFGSSLMTHFTIEICKYIFKIIRSRVPEYLYDKFEFSSSNRTYNLNIPRSSSLQTRRSFFVLGARIWNNLPV